MTKEDFYKNLDRISTERLLLRPMTVADLEDIYEYASDREVVQYLRWGPHPNRAFTLEYIEEVLSEYSNGKDGPWVIQLKDPAKVVGAIHAMDLDRTHNSAEIGYVLSRCYWNRGIMTEALMTVIRYLFRKLELNRIQAFHKLENVASRRVLEKCGMKLEGILREYKYEKERYWDFGLYSMLRREYLESGKENA